MRKGIRENPQDIYDRVLGTYGAKDPAQVARLLRNHGYAITGVDSRGVSWTTDDERGTVGLEFSKETGRFHALAR